MTSIHEVEGRYEFVWGEGSTARLFLSKNPAGWIEIIELLMRSSHPVLIVINAEIADGKDTSWLWDVPFERLRGKQAIALVGDAMILRCACRTPKSTSSPSPISHRHWPVARSR